MMQSDSKGTAGMMQTTETNTEDSFRARLDQWLWAARFFKTRTLARLAVIEGKIMYNGNPARPSQVVAIGDKIDLKLGVFSKRITVEALCSRRRNMSDAALLFTEQ